MIRCAKNLSNACNLLGAICKHFSKTLSNNYFENLKYWRQLTGMAKDQGYVVYGGTQSMQTNVSLLARIFSAVSSLPEMG